MPGIVGGIRDDVTLCALQWSAEIAAGKVRLVSTDAERAGRLIAECIARGRRVITATVACAAFAGRCLNDAIHVQSRSDEVSLCVDDFPVAAVAARGLRVR